jgi:hypothetical protein
MERSRPMLGCTGRSPAKGRSREWRYTDRHRLRRF